MSPTQCRDQTAYWQHQRTMCQFAHKYSQGGRNNTTEGSSKAWSQTEPLAVQIQPSFLVDALLQWPQGMYSRGQRMQVP